MKKLGKYYANIFNTYGILTPIVVVSLLFVVIIAMDRNDTFSALIEASKGWFITLAVVGSLTVIACVVLILLKVKSATVNAVDLALLIVSVLTVLMLVLFCFEPGVKTSVVTYLKWIVTALVLLGSMALSVYRSRQLK